MWMDVLATDVGFWPFKKAQMGVVASPVTQHGADLE
jgi:hypothetical protein